MALLSSSDFNKNLLSVSLERVNEASLIIIVDLYSKIKHYMVLSIHLTISKVYFTSNYSQSHIFDNG